METTPNKYITVAYELYVTEDNEQDLVEKATEEHPFQFISGLGSTLEAFEEQLVNLNPGDKFNFTIPVDQAYGDYQTENVIELQKEIFEIDGKFDETQFYPGVIIPLATSDGGRLQGSIEEVKENTVVVDLNHPLAGKDLNFVGSVVNSRPATNEEIQGMINMMSGGGGCSCGCDGCDDSGCGDDGHDHEGGCCGGGCH